MTAASLGPWAPMSIADVRELFSNATFRWFVTGGHALELHADRSWRSHDDVDIGISRQDAPLLADVLEGFDIYVAAAGVLTPWDGSPLDPDPTAHQNNLWVRPSPGEAWCLDIAIGAGDDDNWIYRRDHSIKELWSNAVLLSNDATPYLAPELQLLFKSVNVRDKDTIDANEVIPSLDQTTHARLASWLPAEHPWQEIPRRTLSTRPSFCDPRASSTDS